MRGGCQSGALCRGDPSPKPFEYFTFRNNQPFFSLEGAQADRCDQHKGKCGGKDWNCNEPIRLDAEPSSHHKNGRHSIGAKSHRRRRPAPLEKQIVEMPAVSREGRAPLADAAKDGKKEIQQWQSGKSQGKKQMRSASAVSSIKIQT